MTITNEVRYVLLLSVRNLSTGLTANQLRQSRIHKGTVADVLKNGWLEKNVDNFSLSESGLKMAHTLFPIFDEQLTVADKNRGVSSKMGQIYAFGLTGSVGNLKMKYLKDKTGQQTDNLNEAVFVRLYDWQTGKDLKNKYGVNEIVYSKIFETKPISHMVVDYSDWLD